MSDTLLKHGPDERSGVSEPREAEPSSPPFADFIAPLGPRTDLKARITAAYRRPEEECLPELIAAATLPPEASQAASSIARELVLVLRAKRGGAGIEGLIQEYSLSSQEGVALMCLAEALLRIPDRSTRDALIRDKIASGDWRSHLGGNHSLFVNAATWGLVVTGKLVSPVKEKGLSSALTRLIGRYGEPVIRKGVDIAMRMMGEQFVAGETIEEALKNGRAMEAKGFRYSYDMLGEAAMTAADADRYFADYERAIDAIGAASAGRGVSEGPGISIKLSALHPRYTRAQAGRIMQELLPRVKALALRARQFDIGLNIDAEEADRLELSLEILEALCFDPDLAGWNGIGFVVQAYSKRCPFVIDTIIDLARRSGHRIMVRLVKGAYWDAEIKRAQVDGLEDYPVFTRKVHTDVCYLACARKLLTASDVVFPQFATHNAHTLAAVLTLAGDDYYPGQYEFQCLHGMGESLYEEVVGTEKLNRPCRIYAPVGTHETLLAYLVRRLLENGANTSFVNRIADESVPVEALIADPAEVAKRIQPPGAPHEKIALPSNIYGAVRKNSAGLDLSNEDRLAELAAVLRESATVDWKAAPTAPGGGPSRPVVNPADHRDIVGTVMEASPETVDAAVAEAAAAAARWAQTPPSERAACLERAANLMQAQMQPLLGLIVREAGKSLPNAISEVREAIDFLRYYASEVRRSFHNETHRPLGPVVCISPWNFPLAIFTGQVSAALAAGNTVLAKPAEETPLIAAQGVNILHQAGIPRDVLHLLPGAGEVGAALVAHPDIRGVVFTGSTEVARLIQKQLAGRLSPEGSPLALIAETGGQNAMIVDSSALAEQVVADAVVSAFDSAGQRCSALRILCLQEEFADRTLAMLKGALHELNVGNPDRLSVDVGPVITAEAQAGILRHIEAMKAKGFRVEQAEMHPDAAHGAFVPPAIIEIDRISRLEREVFGPVLHVIRYRRRDLDRLIDDINATGYGLTFGLHTRLDETIAYVTSRVRAGNIYVNRNIVGATVGVQPFGGRGLSGTGPKAGGPLYLLRLLSERPMPRLDRPVSAALPQFASARAYIGWLRDREHAEEAARCKTYISRSALGLHTELPGPVGERNLYSLHSRGRVLVLPLTETGLLIQIGAALASGNEAVVERGAPGASALQDLPDAASSRIRLVEDLKDESEIAAALVEGDADRLRDIAMQLAEKPGQIVPMQGLSTEDIASGRDNYCLDWLLDESSVSINTAAAGGNASLMTIG